jgi:hypothetical protein
MEKTLPKLCKNYSTSTVLYERIERIVKTYHRFCARERDRERETLTHTHTNMFPLGGRGGGDDAWFTFTRNINSQNNKCLC